MARQVYQDLMQDPPIANLAAITATTETALWNAAQFTPIPANICRAGQIWELRAGGIMSFAATGALTITPRFGLTVAAGITMGASIAKTGPTATTNQPWSLFMSIIIRTVGAPGVNSTVIGTGHFITNALTTAGSEFAQTFGGTSATVDLSINSGITIGWTLSVAGTCTPQYCYLVSAS
jgi:hypothetical protein